MSRQQPDPAIRDDEQLRVVENTDLDRYELWDGEQFLGFEGFHQHEDALVFASLGTRSGCHDLMAAIRYRDNFCPEATWLVAGPDGCVGTVQGLLDDSRFGGIQNLGVVPER